MNEKKLSKKSVAILATDGFEQSELFEPLKALQDAGADVKIVSLKSGEIKGWDKKDWGKSIGVDLTVAKASAHDFDGLVLPGGVMNPDSLRLNEAAVAFVREFGDAGKPIAAICHGPWTLINAGLVQGRTLTSWPSLEADLTNAGATWVDKEVVSDGGLVTSRKPADLAAFNRKFIEELEEGSERASRGVA
jgi:protease I